MWSPTHPALFACVDGMGRLDLWNLNNDTEVSSKITKIALKNRKLEIYWIICEILFIPRNVKGLCDCSIITKKPNKLCTLNNKQHAVQNWREKYCCQEHWGISFYFWKAPSCLMSLMLWQNLIHKATGIFFIHWLESREFQTTEVC